MFILLDVIIKIASHTHSREEMEGWYVAHSVCCCVLKTLSRCLRKCKHVILTTRAFSSVCMLSTRIISLPCSPLLINTHTHPHDSQRFHILNVIFNVNLLRIYQKIIPRKKKEKVCLSQELPYLQKPADACLAL